MYLTCCAMGSNPTFICNLVISLVYALFMTNIFIMVVLIGEKFKLF